MFDDPRGPITHFEWAKFIINGAEHSPGKGVGKDILLSKHGVRPWSEREGHLLKRKMLASALELMPEVLIIGKGVNGAIIIGKKVPAAAKKAGVKELIVLETPQACAKYNQLVQEGKNVVLLAHGTC